MVDIKILLFRMQESTIYIFCCLNLTYIQKLSLKTNIIHQ